MSKTRLLQISLVFGISSAIWLSQRVRPRWITTRPRSEL